MICYRRLLGCQDENILLIRYYFVKTLLGLVPEAFEHGVTTLIIFSLIRGNIKRRFGGGWLRDGRMARN